VTILLPADGIAPRESRAVIPLIVVGAATCRDDWLSHQQMNSSPGLKAGYSAPTAPYCSSRFFKGSDVTPAALIFVVCHALAEQGPLDVNGFPVDGVKLDYGTCRNEFVQIFDQTEGGQSTPQHPDLSNPNVCSRMSMSETAHWERDHPGWHVRVVKCPHPDGTFPGDTDV
jgi:hypothetical protein